ncbi:MAG: hypothetical protein R3D28_02680 [Geminicoccaceae bacterium]
MRRTWLRGRDNVQKRYLIHIAGYNLGLIMRLLTGSAPQGAGRARTMAVLALDAARCRSPEPFACDRPL